MDFGKISVFQVGNDGGAVGHDGDGVVVFSLVFQDFLRQLPGFFYGSHGGLVGLFDGFEVFGLGDQDDVIRDRCPNRRLHTSEHSACHCPWRVASLVSNSRYTMFPP